MRPGDRAQGPGGDHSLVVALWTAAFLAVAWLSFGLGPRHPIVFAGILGTLFAIAVLDVLAFRRSSYWRRSVFRMPLRTLHVWLRGESVRTCPYCLDVVLESDPTSTCDDCRTVYHEDCREELRIGCGTIGCSSREPARVRLKS